MVSIKIISVSNPTSLQTMIFLSFTKYIFRILSTDVKGFPFVCLFLSLYQFKTPVSSSVLMNKNEVRNCSSKQKRAKKRHCSSESVEKKLTHFAPSCGVTSHFLPLITQPSCYLYPSFN